MWLCVRVSVWLSGGSITPAHVLPLPALPVRFYGSLAKGCSLGSSRCLPPPLPLLLVGSRASPLPRFPDGSCPASRTPATFCGSRSGWPRPGPGLEERGPPGSCGHTSRCWEAPGARFVPPVPFRGEKQRSAWFGASLGSRNTDFSPWFFVLFETSWRCRTRLAVFSFLSFGQKPFLPVYAMEISPARAMLLGSEQSPCSRLLSLPAARRSPLRLKQRWIAVRTRGAPGTSSRCFGTELERRAAGAEHTPALCMPSNSSSAVWPKKFGAGGPAGTGAPS